MSRAFTQIYYHIVFSTKQRQSLITPALETELFPTIGGIVRDLRGKLLAINGTTDHVHLLVRCRADLSLSDLVRHIKARSSKWVHETHGDLASFAWQEGYGGFSVSKSMTPDVENYIRGQKDHHRQQDFRVEYLELLRRHEIEFDEAEVFD